VFAGNLATLASGDTPSDGVALTVAVGGEILETGRLVWPTWDRAPAVKQREKASLPIVAAFLRALSDNP
jgi:hypothetical protein